MSQTDPTKVTARARKAAANLAARRGDSLRIVEDMHSGELDNGETAQAFAAFERQLLDEAKREIEGLKAIQPSSGDSERRNRILEEALARLAALGGEE